MALRVEPGELEEGGLEIVGARSGAQLRRRAAGDNLAGSDE